MDKKGYPIGSIHKPAKNYCLIKPSCKIVKKYILSRKEKNHYSLRSKLYINKNIIRWSLIMN